MYIIWMKRVHLHILFFNANIGFAIGTRGRGYVIVSSNQKQTYQAQPGRQEWVTVIECICADGTSIQPLIIFKGVNLQSGWIPTGTEKE